MTGDRGGRWENGLQLHWLSARINQLERSTMIIWSRKGVRGRDHRIPMDGHFLQRMVLFLDLSRFQLVLTTPEGPFVPA